MRPLVSTSRVSNEKEIQLSLTDYLLTYVSPLPISLWNFSENFGVQVFNNSVNSSYVASSISGFNTLGGASGAVQGGQREHLNNRAAHFKNCLVQTTMPSTGLGSTLTWEGLVCFNELSSASIDKTIPYFGRNLRFYYSGTGGNTPLTLYAQAYQSDNLYGTVSATIPFALNPYVWYHLVFTREEVDEAGTKTLTIKIYVNGTEVASASDSWPIIGLLGPDLTPESHLLSSSLDVKLDFVAIYDYALSAEDVLDHYRRINCIIPRIPPCVGRYPANHNYFAPYDQFLNPYEYSESTPLPLREKTTGWFYACPHVGAGWQSSSLGNPMGWLTRHSWTVAYTDPATAMFDAWDIYSTIDESKMVRIRWDKMTTETGYNGKPFLCYSVSGGAKCYPTLFFEVMNPTVPHTLTFWMKAEAGTLYNQRGTTSQNAGGICVNFYASSYSNGVYENLTLLPWRPFYPTPGAGWIKYEYTVTFPQRYRELGFIYTMGGGVDGTISISNLSLVQTSGSPSYLTPRCQNSTYPYVREANAYSSGYATSDIRGAGDFAVCGEGQRSPGWLPPLVVLNSTSDLQVSPDEGNHYKHVISNSGGRSGAGFLLDRNAYDATLAKIPYYPDEPYAPCCNLHYMLNPNTRYGQPIRGTLEWPIGFEDIVNVGLAGRPNEAVWSMKVVPASAFSHPEWLLWNEGSYEVGTYEERQTNNYDNNSEYRFVSLNLDNQELRDLMVERVIKYVTFYKSLGFKWWSSDSGWTIPTVSARPDGTNAYQQNWEGTKTYDFNNFAQMVLTGLRDIITRVQAAVPGMKVALNCSGQRRMLGPSYTQNPEVTGTWSTAYGKWWMGCVDLTLDEFSFNWSGGVYGVDRRTLSAAIGNNSAYLGPNETNLLPYPSNVLSGSTSGWINRVNQVDIADDNGNYPIMHLQFSTCSSTGDNNIPDPVRSYPLQRRTFGYCYASVLMAASFGHKNVAFSVMPVIRKLSTDTVVGQTYSELNYHFPLDDWDLGIPLRPYDIVQSTTATAGNDTSTGLLARAFYSNSLILINVPQWCYQKYYAGTHVAVGPSYTYTLDQNYYDHVTERLYTAGTVLTLPPAEAFIGEIRR